MKRLLTILAAASLLGACAPKSDDSKSTPQGPAPTSPDKPGPATEAGYKPLTPEQLFASKYQSVDVVCDFFVADENVGANGGGRGGKLRLPVFPLANKGETVFQQSPSGLFQVKVELLAPTLSTIDMKIDGKIVSQSPFFRMTGNYNGDWNPHESVSMSSYRPVSALISPEWNDPQELGAINLENTSDAKTQAAHSVLRCHAEAVALPEQK